MAARLKVGTYILDAAASGSTSTTSGVRLWLGPDGPVAKWSEARASMEVTFFAQVVAASAAALKTALEALRAAVLYNSNSDLVLERVSGTTLFQWTVSDGTYSRITGELDVQQLGAIDTSTDQHVALVALIFKGERVGVASDGAGDPVDALEPLDWGVAFDANGRGTCTVTAPFQTRTAAMTFAAGLRASNRPAWMGTAWRFVTVSYNVQQQLNQTSPVPEAAWQPCVVTVVFRALPSAFAGQSAFTDVVDIDYTVQVRPRQPVGERAGSAAGFDVALTGSVQFKTEKDSTFDTSDTSSVSAGDLRSKTLACLALIKQDAQTRSGFTFTEMDAPELTAGGATGEMGFSLTGVSSLPGDNLAYEETLTIETVPTDKVMRGSKGKRVFSDPAGPDVFVRHSLTISALTQPAYTPPSVVASNPAGWLARPSTAMVPPPAVTSNGTRIYNASWTREWEWVGEGSPLG